MSRMPLVIDLPAPEYRALTAFANRRGVQAHVLVEQLVQHALATSRPTSSSPGPAPKAGSRRATTVHRTAPKRSRAKIRSDRDEQFVAVSKLHGRSLNDAQIAAELGISTETARQRRTQLKLPALTRGRPKKTTTNAAPAAEKS